MRKITAAIILVFAVTSALSAAEFGGVTASPYLNLGVGARPSGMGEAYTALVDNVDAAWWNPGGLVKVQNPQFAFMHNANFGGTSYEYLAVGFPAEQFGLDIWGSIGITALLVRVEDIVTQKEEPDGDWSQEQELRAESYGAGGTVIGVSYSWQAAKSFSIGATVKLINQKIALEEGWIPAMDIGMIMNTMLQGFDLGVVFQNVSFMSMDPGVDGAPSAPLPLNLKFGLSYKIPRLFTPEDEPKDNMAVAFDGVLPLNPANMPFKINFGLEYGYNFSDFIVKPRLGYRFNGNQFISDLGWFSGLTFGFGLSRNFDGLDVALDYAFTSYDSLGSSHKMGMTINVGQPTPTPTPKPLNPPKLVKLKVESKKIWVQWSIDKDSKVKIAGYNVYMSYKPGGKYYKLTKTPVASPKYYLKVGPLKSGLRVYFVVTAVDEKGRESKYSKEISAVPK
ncbi:MAG: PorV/PorQ family protein [Spirochaetia bacterium]|nr:PorV/PorQ family protein [Spirochaetia bacterium]